MQNFLQEYQKGLRCNRYKLSQYLFLSPSRKGHLNGTLGKVVSIKMFPIFKDFFFFFS